MCCGPALSCGSGEEGAQQPACHLAQLAEDAKAQDVAALEAMRARDIATWNLDTAQRSALAAGHTVETHFSVNDFQQPRFAGSPVAKRICRTAANQNRERSNSRCAATFRVGRRCASRGACDANEEASLDELRALEKSGSAIARAARPS